MLDLFILDFSKIKFNKIFCIWITYFKSKKLYLHIKLG